MKISIPNPCTVLLSDMTSVEGGKYCASCAHTVIDFSNWSKEEVQAHFKNSTGKTCGIFTEEQLNKDELVIHLSPRINYAKLSVMQRFLCALLICFGSWLFSCNTHESYSSTETTSYAFLMQDDSTCSDDITDIEDNLEHRVYGSPMVDHPISDENGIWDNLDVDSRAQFPGGTAALETYLQEHLYSRSPEGAYGKVYVRFTVNQDGSIENPMIPQSDLPIIIKKEIGQIIKGMPKWKPGKHEGKNVASYYELTIRFDT